MRTQLVVSTLAAALALGLTAPIVADHADARPVQWTPPPDRGGDLRAENAALRAELARYRATFDRGLDRIEDATRNVRDRRAATRLRRAIDDLRVELGNGWRDDRYDRPGPDRPGRPDRPVGPGRDDHRPGQVVGMPDADYQRLLAAVGAANFPAEQLDVINAAAPYYAFTSDQVIGLMRAVSFDDNRLAIATTLFPRVVDPGRFYLAYEALDFPSSKDALRKRLGQ
ncbi:MAG: DUF4476 domain-containing protein [Kofleriaceae bacterium]|nr:DUF4476 domain-containing protein [Kofleriaceae bacterium]MBP9170196.1 DUF4476 domain-containing protein [Kofleriaceae bacterium]MBP9859809.1 DUF4476 domain-containing protein [Kofleriaceae bacterium]